MNFIPKIEFESGGTQTITFDLPPSDDIRAQNYRTSEKTSTSNNGKQQTQFNFVEDNITLNFTFISESIKQQMDSFMTTHALRGLEFKYFESEDEVEFVTVRLSAKVWAPVILFQTNTLNEFEYEFRIVMREFII